MRKRKVHAFLLWLKSHNFLYRRIPISQDNVDLYRENDILPGLLDTVIVDESSDPVSVHAEETAGFDPHPSSAVVHEDGDDPSTPKLCVERMAIHNAEGDATPSRTMTAAALRNLLPRPADTETDLTVYRGTRAISEYNNHNLFPGMFPTLFPYGLGGFEDPLRPVPVAFQCQAEYYLTRASNDRPEHCNWTIIYPWSGEPDYPLLSKGGWAVEGWITRVGVQWNDEGWCPGLVCDEPDAIWYQVVSWLSE